MRRVLPVIGLSLALSFTAFAAPKKDLITTTGNTKATGWVKEDGYNWSYFDENGEIVTGWLQLDGTCHSGSVY